MIKSMKMKLSGGEFEIRRDTEFSVSSDTLAHLVYEKNDVWIVESDPCRGKYAKTVITIPYQHSFYDVSIEITDAVAHLCRINCDNFEIIAKKSVFDTDSIFCQNLYIKASSSEIGISADCVTADTDCGHGVVNLRLKPYEYGYKLTSQCGMGNVTLNSALLPKRYTSPSGERRIKVICGMGDVNINI